jgi:ribokinase
VPRVLVVGSANVDYTVAAPRLPAPGETVTNGTLLVNHGGKGANQAVAARRLGADVRLIGCVGDDAAGRAIRAGLEAEGVGADGVMVSAEAATGTALITVDPAGRNQIAVAPGANRALTLAHLEARGDDFAWAEAVIVSCEIPVPAVRAALARARARATTTVLNPAPVPDAGLDCLALVDYLTPNAGEAERLSGIRGDGDAAIARAAAALRAQGARCVLVTLGERGVLACAEGAPLSVPAFAVSAVDTTAAGDAFNGALAVALTERRPLPDAVRFATVAAALACTRRGAQASLPRRAEVDRAAG